MKNFFPPQRNSGYLQTNRSDVVGSLWSSFNLDFQTNLGVIRLAQKLVTNTTSSDDADLGVASAFEFFNSWYAICDTTIFKTAGTADITSGFTEDTAGYIIAVGTVASPSTTQFDVTNPAGTTFRYTYDGTGTDPNINATTVPVGSVVTIVGTNMAAGNRGTFTVTGSGANFFEVTNASGVVESNKTVGTSGSIKVAGGSASKSYLFQESDLSIFDDRLWSTSGGLTPKLYSLNSAGTTWTPMDDLGANSLHKLCYFQNQNRLYYTYDQSNIYSIDAANSIADSGDQFSIDLGTTIGQITTMVATSSLLWIGTIETQNASGNAGTQGSIVAWDGVGLEFTKYELLTAGCLAMVVIDNIPYAIDTEGRVLQFNQQGFQEIARLPVDRILLQGSTRSTGGLSTGRPIHFNGMAATKNNTILVSVRNRNEDNDFTHTENLPSGIWELDLGTRNFTHRYSFSLKSLASSTITDYGQNIVSRVGAIKLNTFADATTGGRGTILAGATYFTDATATKSAIYIDSPAKPAVDTEGQKRGYFVTTWFESNEAQDKWERLWTTYRRFLNSTDKMIFKYRLEEEAPVEATITWTSTTTFTTTTDVSAYDPSVQPFNGTTGGEVEVLQGTGSGSCTHILGVVNNGGTYTVTLDTAVTGVTGTAKARFQKWIKLYPDVTGQVLSWAQLAIGNSNSRIQTKTVMEFTGDDEFHKLAIFSNEDIKISP